MEQLFFFTWMIFKYSVVVLGLLVFCLILPILVYLSYFHLRSRFFPVAESTTPEGNVEITSTDFLLPESKYIEVDDLRLHYLQGGHGPDIVLFHGIGASVFIWRFIFPFLLRDHRVTAIDIAGFGKSSKHKHHDHGLDSQTQVLSHALLKLGIEKAGLVGSSMGGALVLWMARTDPSRFQKVAVIAPASDGRLVPIGIELFSFIFHLLIPLFRRSLNRQTMSRILSRVVARHALLTDSTIDAYLEPFRDRGESLKTFWDSLRIIRDKRLPRELNLVKAHVLVLYGEKDLMVPKQTILNLMGILPTATLLIHVDGGHHLMEDEPTWTAKALLEFFN